MNTVIKVENLSKQYRLGTVGTGTIGHDLNRWYQTTVRRRDDPYLKIGEENDRSVKGGSEYVWALRDINFDVKQGEVLGIIGRNGAGKSTLLKILSRTTSPTTGSVKLKGRVASLLEVGTGFHPELSGRENIFLNGAILGMTKQEIKSKFDEIVDFAGVERYIDTPVKRYSSGMYVRLAFGVAAHLEPEILIVDEVLAVGDAEFQKKALGKMKQVSEGEGRTILFVSHNMPAIKTLCKSGMLLDNGQVKYTGSADETITQYFKRNADTEGHFTPGRFSAEEKVVIKSASICNQRGEQTETFQVGDDLVVNVIIESENEYVAPHFFIAIRSNFGGVSGASTMLDGNNSIRFKKGENAISCTFKSLPLLPQQYYLSMGIRGSDARAGLTASKEIGYFTINTRMKDLGVDGEVAERMASESVSPLIPYEWNFGNGIIKSFNLFNNVKR
ncbi:MAG: ABC transporter ATP-binding protein [Ginsengibacter sp.]